MSQEFNKHGIKRINTYRKPLKRIFEGDDNWAKKRWGIFKKYNRCCYYCGTKLDFKTFTVDHLLSRYKGGNDNFENLVPCCYKCNQSKDYRTLEEFRERFFKGQTKNLFYGEKLEQERLENLQKENKNK